MQDLKENFPLFIIELRTEKLIARIGSDSLEEITNLLKIQKIKM
jgi:hypothetical protein